MERSNNHHIVDIIFVLSLFCVFAVMALFVVVLGANVYKSINSNMTSNYNSRTSVAYITEKVHQSDTPGSVKISELSGSDALVLTQELEGQTYETWIYIYEGQLSEVLVKQGRDPSPSAGQTIMELAALDLEDSSTGLIKIGVTDVDGNQYESMVSLMSGV